MRAHVRVLQYLHLGAEGALKICVRVRASINFIYIYFYLKILKINTNLVKKCAGVGAKTLVRVCVPHTIKMSVMCVRVRSKIHAH